MGYSYADAAAARVIRSDLGDVLRGHPVMDIARAWWRMAAGPAQHRSAGGRHDRGVGAGRGACGT